MATVRLIPRRAALLAALAAFALVACTQDDSEPTASAEATEAATAAGSEPLSAEQVFAAVSPSIAFVETPIATGSGILITEFHLVTNAHVVWPFEQVRVLFPDGSEYLDSPVIGWDLMADLAVIELPGGGSLQPTGLASGESLAVGSELYLIGYPAEGELFPQPSISRGILSRFRTWEQPGIRYIQTDASIEGGQSGGALVSAAGEIVGLSGFSLGSGNNFGIAISAPEVMRRVEGMLRGDDVDGLGDRRLPTVGGRSEHAFTLLNYYAESVFVLREPVGAAVELEVESDHDATISVIEADGLSALNVDDTATGLELGEVFIALDAPSFVVVSHFEVTPGDFTLRSSSPLIPLADPDDGRTIDAGTTLAASLDYIGDVDFFEIELARGQTITVLVDSANFDPEVRIDLPDNADVELGYDDDSGRGFFGVNASLVFTAEETARYLIVVSDVTVSAAGGYFITVE